MHLSAASLCAWAVCAACGQAAEDAPPIDPTYVSAFAKYCTASLTKGRAATKSVSTNEWRGGVEVGAGTNFLLGDDYDDTLGYVLFDDDTVALLDPTDLADPNAFATTCPDHGSETVALTNSTFYSTSARRGTPCRIERGTVITSHTILSWPSYAQVDTPEVEALCGFTPGYTNDFIYGDLRLK